MFILNQISHFYLSAYPSAYRETISQFIMETLTVSSCMCLDLRTGGVVIGCLQLTAQIVLFIYGFQFLTIPENIVIFGE